MAPKESKKERMARMARARASRGRAQDRDESVEEPDVDPAGAQLLAERPAFERDFEDGIASAARREQEAIDEEADELERAAEEAAQRAAAAVAAARAARALASPRKPAPPASPLMGPPRTPKQPTPRPPRANTPSRPGRGAPRAEPCLGCVKSALEGRLRHPCCDTDRGGARCWLCASGHPCRSLPSQLLLSGTALVETFLRYQNGEAELKEVTQLRTTVRTILRLLGEEDEQESSDSDVTEIKKPLPRSKDAPPGPKPRRKKKDDDDDRDVDPAMKLFSLLGPAAAYIHARNTAR